MTWGLKFNSEVMEMLEHTCVSSLSRDITCSLGRRPCLFSSSSALTFLDCFAGSFSDGNGDIHGFIFLLLAYSEWSPHQIFLIFLEVWHLWWGHRTCSHQALHHPSPLYVSNPGLGSQDDMRDSQGVILAHTNFLISWE